MLYVAFACSGGTCPQYAADTSNPAFRQWWIGFVQSAISPGYKGVWIDDVNMLVEVSDGTGAQVFPVDPATGQPFVYQVTGASATLSCPKSAILPAQDEKVAKSYTLHRKSG